MTMTLTLVVLGLASIFELLLWWKPAWHRRQFIAPVLMGILAVTSGVLLGRGLSTWVILLVLLNIYRIVNLLRVKESRIQVDYLYHASRHTSLWLIGGQTGVLLLTVMIAWTGLVIVAVMYALLGIVGLASIGLLLSTLRQLKKAQPPDIETGIADRDLPSLTVAIPARNETTDLEACLRSLLASSYPKLEILVLDDCSQERRTPEIIRSFAHDGVRFLAGTPPPRQWLAKNHAYAQLAAASSGELMLFCGVDSRFQTESLTALVKILLQKQKSMLSVLPANELPGRQRLLSLCVQPGRYAWELILPRRLVNRPAVLSTCWLITRRALETAGGFAAVSRKAMPESYFARTTSQTNDAYSFIISNSTIGVRCIKTLDEQRATAIRTRYPQLHRRPEMVVLVSLAESVLLIWPLVVAAAASLAQAWLLAVLAGLLCLINAYTYSRVVNLTYRRFQWPGLIILPVSAIYDLGLLHYSMWQYEFGEVVWKGRSVSFPVMRVIASLPPMPARHR